MSPQNGSQPVWQAFTVTELRQKIAGAQASFANWCVLLFFTGLGFISMVIHGTSISAYTHQDTTFPPWVWMEIGMAALLFWCVYSAVMVRRSWCAAELELIRRTS